MKMQQNIWEWACQAFGREAAQNKDERNYRFLEEALELVQSLGCSKEDALKLVDYVYERPAGEPYQEVGGVSITLHLLCEVNGLFLDDCTEVELKRIYEKIEQIREKQANKPTRSPLPQ